MRAAPASHRPLPAAVCPQGSQSSRLQARQPPCGAAAPPRARPALEAAQEGRLSRIAPRAECAGPVPSRHAAVRLPALLLCQTPPRSPTRSRARLKHVAHASTRSAEAQDDTSARPHASSWAFLAALCTPVRCTLVTYAAHTQGSHFHARIDSSPLLLSQSLPPFEAADLRSSGLLEQHGQLAPRHGINVASRDACHHVLAAAACGALQRPQAVHRLDALGQLAGLQRSCARHFHTTPAWEPGVQCPRRLLMVVV